MSNFDGIQYYGDHTLEHTILQNVMQFAKYGFLEIGAYRIITTGMIGPNGQDHSRLHPVGVTGVTPYTVYAGTKPDWVYETGVTPKSAGVVAPSVPSGILFNGTFFPTGSPVLGTGYYIDFSRGQVVFANPVPSGSVVQCPHSERWVSVYPKESQEYYKLVSSLDWFGSAGSSGVSLSSEQIAYMPCLFVSIPSYDTVRGTHLGSRSKVTNVQISFDIFATNPNERAILQDVCYFLEDKPLPIINYKDAPRPLNYQGQLVSGVTWNTLSSSHRIANGLFKQDARVSKPAKDHLPLKYAKVSISLEVDLIPS